MTYLQAQSCGNQLKLLFCNNREHINPFNLYFCNVNKGNLSIKTLHKHIPTLYDIDFPLNITQKSYMDLFPRDRLVYLTPHCRTYLNTWDHDAIYIIGALFDNSSEEHLTLAKAKENGLKYAKLPFEKYISWGPGSSKSIPLNQVRLWVT